MNVKEKTKNEVEKPLSKKEQDKKVDEELEETFPASDSPQHNGTHI